MKGLGQPARPAVKSEDNEALKAAYIAKHGVTKCPRPDELAPPRQVPVEQLTQPSQKQDTAPTQLKAPKPTPARDFGTKPMLMWVPTTELFIDHGYQRSISTRRGEKVIKDIVAGFRWPLFQPVTITQREESGYWLIDGQHRMTAARQLGIREIPAVLLDNLTSSEQALAFAGINGKRVAVNAYAIHHAMIAADDPFSVRLAAVCEKTGVSVPRYPKMATLMKPGETLAIAALKTVMRMHGDDALIWTLSRLIEAYPGEPGVITAMPVKVLAAFYNRYADIFVDTETMNVALSEVDIEEMREKAAQEAATSGLRISSIVAALACKYNEITLARGGTKVLPTTTQ